MDRVWLAALLFMLAGGMLGWYLHRCWLWVRCWAGPRITISVGGDVYHMTAAERRHRILAAALRRPMPPPTPAPPPSER